MTEVSFQSTNRRAGLAVMVLSLLLFTLLFATPARAEIVSDSSKDFSDTANPNGTWSYGWKSDGIFNLFSECRLVRGLKFWESPDFPDTTGDGVKAPNVVCNTSSDVQSSDGIEFQPQDMTFHPGPSGETGVLRWTAPFNGRASVSAAFARADFGTTTVVIRHNEQPLFTHDFPGEADATEFQGAMTVHAGDTIDFEVDSDGDYGGDTVRVRALVAMAGNRPAKFPLAGRYTGTVSAGKRVLGYLVVQVDKNLKVSGRLLMGRKFYNGSGSTSESGAAQISFALPNSPLVLRFNAVKTGSRVQLQGSGNLNGTAVRAVSQREQ